MEKRWKAAGTRSHPWHFHISSDFSELLGKYYGPVLKEIYDHQRYMLDHHKVWCPEVFSEQNPYQLRNWFAIFRS